jgi:DNA-binding winged helix-turn-helix (wHTH) protein
MGFKISEGSVKITGTVQGFPNFSARPMETRFGECLLDPSSRVLRRAGCTVGLSPKAYELLEFLVATRPRAVSKSELMERLWPSTVVVEANLSNLVAEVRAAIADDARRPRFIRTVHGFGYAFCGDAAAEPAGAAPGRRDSLCWVVYGDSRIQLTEGDHLIGRHPASIVVIESPTVSRHHAAIRVAGVSATLLDLGSRNGTFLGGERIGSSVALKHGDRIRVGSVVLEFQMASLGPGTEADGLTHYGEPGR